MNDILKQRLVGALILVALGVIFWPIIFVQPETEDIAEPRPMPPAPAVSTERVPVPDDSGLRSSPPLAAHEETAQGIAQEVDVIAAEPVEAEPEIVAQTEAQPSPAATPTRSEPPQKLAMDADGVPIAWTLQVATLSSSGKADELRRRLLALDHKAYVADVQRGGKTLYRVCIGPKFERAELEQLQPQVDAAFGVKSLVARYVP